MVPVPHAAAGWADARHFWLSLGVVLLVVIGVVWQSWEPV
jgi:hypothetical protein